MVVASQQRPTPTAEDTMMNSSTAKKVFGTIVAAVTLTMVTSVAPASAVSSDNGDRGGRTLLRDTGWDKP
jgi:hypothetical protein